jgi:peroxiredoxin Q/BCP
MFRRMTLKVGDVAPDFDVTSSDGRRLRLEELRGTKNLVLYFYPGDFTPVCTAEACGFRDMYDELVGKDTEVIGVSTDDDARHAKFAARHHLSFPLIADPERTLARRYGATGGLLGTLRGSAQRVTYVIGKDGRIHGVFDSALLASRHLQGARAVLDRLP